jgi:hypothetical protein
MPVIPRQTRKMIRLKSNEKFSTAFREMLLSLINPLKNQVNQMLPELTQNLGRFLSKLEEVVEEVPFAMSAGNLATHQAFYLAQAPT